MPTYEYHCDACNHHFDEFQSINDPALKKCPKCKKRKLRRIFGIGAAVLFKGSGFYQTDYRSDSYKAAAKAEQDSGKPASGDKTGKSDTSSAEKTAVSDKPAAKSAKSAT
jgi:putative FmdB family regulatory protein